MRLNRNKGFLMIMICSVLAALILIASVVVSFGCSEMLATRTRNDLLVSAYYVAISGCELMYAYQSTLTSPSWNTPVTGTISVGTNTIGSYNAVAYDAGGSAFYIVSNGTVSGHTAKAVVKLGYSEDYKGTLAAGSYGPVTINGASTPAKIMMDGPVASASDSIIITGRVSISGDPASIPLAGVPKIDFWLDVDRNGSYANDANGDGQVTLAEAEGQSKTDAFIADDLNSDGVINGKDSFIYYYTIYLNNPANNPLHTGLNIGVGETYYYPTDQTLSSSSIPDSTPIIFVNGNCTITDNDGSTSDHTVVVTGNLTLHSPNNATGDRNTYIVYGNVLTDGEMGDAGGTKGDIIIFANGNIDKEGGGKMNASLYANGTLKIDTAGDTGKEHLMLSKLTESWRDANGNVVNAPLGLGDSGYPDQFSHGFTIKNQTDYPPVWQRE